MGIVVTEQGFRGGPNAQLFLQLFTASLGDPGALRGKALHVVLLLLQKGFGDQHGEIDILMSGLLKFFVQNGLDVFPESVSVGPKDKHTLHTGVVDELRLPAHVGVPLGKVGLHIGDLLYLLLIVLRHMSLRPFW